MGVDHRRAWERRPWTWLGGVSALVGFFAWLLGWIFHFGPTLINDEYAAIDYFYRIVQGRHFYPTPDKLHKPLSVLMGFFSWVAESPLGYEIAVAAAAAAFVALVFVVVRKELGLAAAAAATLAVAANPEVMYYSATGNTVMPFCAFAFFGLWAALKREESPRWLWAYAASFFLAGLIRPEAWLFAAPLLIWWRPADWRDGRGWARVILAGALIGLGPVIWFGKDWLINGDLMHGIKVATRDKTVGTGAPFSLFETLAFFWVRIPNEVSWPVAAAGAVGAFAFIRERGRRGLTHPFLIFPALVSAYVYLIVYLGVYPVQRYWYFDSVFSIIFCVYLLQALWPRITLPAAEVVKVTLLLVALFGALGYFLVQPESASPDGRWLLTGSALLVLSGAVLLAWPGLLLDLLRRPAAVVALAAVIFIALAYPVFVQGFYEREVSELTLEAQKQREMVTVAKFLESEIPAGRGDRIMVGSRRNEQLNWLFRDRELPDTVSFREAFYLNWSRQMDFLELHPDWIVYIPKDSQFSKPDEMFEWMQYQDVTNWQGATIKLVKSTGVIRVFQVEYPPGHAPKGPLPAIP